jgi:hypothetical protein
MPNSVLYESILSLDKVGIHTGGNALISIRARIEVSAIQTDGKKKTNKTR